MAIETSASMKSILQNYDATKWAKSADLTTNKQFTVQDAPMAGSVGDLPAKSFSELLLDSLNNVNSLQKEANLAIEKLATGKSKNIHETMLMVEKADIAFKAMNQIRLKVIDAYNEIMKMQV